MNMNVFHMDFRKFLVQVFTGSQCQRHLGTFLVIDTFLYTRKSKILGGKVQHTGGFRKRAFRSLCIRCVCRVCRTSRNKKNNRHQQCGQKIFLIHKLIRMYLVYK